MKIRKIKKKIISVSLACSMLTVYSVTSYAYPIWYSNRNNIGHWSSMPVKVAALSFDSAQTAKLMQYNSVAASSWTSAISNLTVSFIGENMPNANIEVIGLDDENAEECYGVHFGQNVCGTTVVPSYTSDGTVTVMVNNQQTTKNKRIYLHDRIYIRYCDTVTNNNSNFSMVCKHELGHALGWDGHHLDQTTNHMMNDNGYSSITADDIAHLNIAY